MSGNREFDFERTFPPLGHSEHHFNKYPDHPWLKTEAEIRGWLETMISDYYKINFVINDDLTVTCKKKFNLLDSITHMPFQIRRINNLEIKDSKLRSMVGMPYSGSSLVLLKNNIDSTEGLGNSNVRFIDLGLNPIKELRGINWCEKLSLWGCNIESFEGFGGCNYLVWWQREWCDKTSYRLLMEVPESVRKIGVYLKFNSNEVKINNYEIDMNWLRNEQRKNKSILESKERINELVKDEYVSKKRKL